MKQVEYFDTSIGKDCSEVTEEFYKNYLGYLIDNV